MKKVLLRAPLLTNSGYGVHSRQVFQWLNEREDVELHVDCVNWGRTSWILDTEKENGLYKEIMGKSKPIERGTYDFSFQVQLPDEWDNSLANHNVGITAAVETDKCSTEWVECCNKMDAVVVPSTFTKNVIVRSGNLKTKVHVIQEWFDPIVFNKSKIGKTLNDERYKNIDTDFNFLLIGQLTGLTPKEDRKNILNTLKWLFEEFQGQKEVGVVIKTGLGKGTSGDKIKTLNYLKEFTNSNRKGDYPKLHIVHGNLEKEELFSLYQHNKIKAFTLCTRGEGYGLPLIEAAASGLPVITTNWSGHLEFLKKGLFYPVDYSLAEIPETKIDNRIFKKGTKWAEPDEASFKSKSREVFENYQEAKNKSKDLKKHINFNYNKGVVSKKYDKLFEEMS